MKNINEYIEESILDMNELSADIAVKKDEVWRDLMETYGQLLYGWREISKDNISFDKKGRIIFDTYVILDLNVIPDCIKKYGLGEITKLKIENYRGKISKLNIYKCYTISFANCRLEFDKTLNCDSIDFELCSIDKLNISIKQPWKSWCMDESTRQNIVCLYMEKLSPGAKELF
jgi:hypothetical protein